MSDAVDIEALKSIRDLGEDVLSEVIDLFFETTPNKMEVIRQALADQNPQGVERAAHFIKGSCSNVGALPMQTLCHSLQEQGASGDLKGAGDTFKDLEREYIAVCAALKRERPA